MINNTILSLSQKSKKPKITIIIRHDKVSHLDTKIKEIPIENKELINIIIKSYETYNREYLHEANGSYISDVSLLQWLRDVTKLDGIPFNMMRSIYITTTLNKKGTTLNDKKKTSPTNDK